ncbi:AMP-binding protein [Alkalihalobacterium alkalinitrilicum]|uniref:AMP-binding protein n=1 Tax=Alkalihalobacterium alkalinitrilicum TaxID=427920 RepID=UPI0009953EFC|nr:AMP-binding protein [Alkalihalobacterium alkalinitrilicum]
MEGIKNFMMVNFGRLMLQTAQHFSGKTALVNVERNRSFTFIELHLLTNKICNMLKDKFGLKTGDVFANLLENDNNSLFSLWMSKSNAAGLCLITGIHMKNICIS